MSIKKLLTISDVMIGHIVDLQKDDKNNVLITLEGKVNESTEIIKKKFVIEINPKLYEQNKLEIDDILLINYNQDDKVEAQKILSIHAGLFSLYSYERMINKLDSFVVAIAFFSIFAMFYKVFTQSYYLSDHQFILSLCMSFMPALFLGGLSGLIRSYSERKRNMIKKFLSHATIIRK